LESWINLSLGTREMNEEAIILAGGLGKRLRSVIAGIPKPMAPLHDRPFLQHLFDFLSHQEFKRVILAVGYKYEIIWKHFKDQYNTLKIEYSIEKEPLGTGGAIKKAINEFAEKEQKFALVLNGDTFFNIDLRKLALLHERLGSDLTLALKERENTGRYGHVIIDEEFRIKDFVEKAHGCFGLINGGIYMIARNLFEKLALPDQFSFEKDLLGRYYKIYDFRGVPFNEYFVDIGIPEDYKRARKELEKFVGVSDIDRDIS